jgi:hypothetical protein
MRNLLITALLFFVFIKWLQFSSPGEYTREELESISASSNFSAILNDPRQLDQPHLVRCRVAHGAGVRGAGYCVLEQGGRQLFTLTRGFPPPSGQEVLCIIIPRAFLMVDGNYSIVAAMVAFRPVVEAGEAISLH